MSRKFRIEIISALRDIHTAVKSIQGLVLVSDLRSTQSVKENLSELDSALAGANTSIEELKNHVETYNGA